MINQIKIVNLKRKKQIKEFFDEDHPVMNKYYDLLDRDLSIMKMRKEMEKLIQKDPDFYDSYLVVADILKSGRKIKAARELLYIAYERALKRIVDIKGNFPEKIEWAWLENRHLVRAIERWGWELWEQKKTDEALEIFRKLLKSNPNDNIGARQNILAIRLGLGPDYETMFTVEDTPGYLSGFKLSEWFAEHCEKFPDEFGWWFEAMDDKE